MPLNEIKKLCHLQRVALEAQDWDLVERIERQKREILKLNFYTLVQRMPQERETVKVLIELCNALKSELEAEMERVRILLLRIRPNLNISKNTRTAMYIYEKA